MHYKYHKINPDCGGLYIDSPNQIKKATRNPINKIDGKYFEDAVRVALNLYEIGKDLDKISKIKPFIDKYKWENKLSIRKI